jgi:hypothetical protein
MKRTGINFGTIPAVQRFLCQEGMCLRWHYEDVWRPIKRVHIAQVMDALGGGVRGQYRINRAASSAAAAAAALPSAHAGSSGACAPRQAGGPHHPLNSSSSSSNAPSGGASNRPQSHRPTGAAPATFLLCGCWSGFSGAPHAKICMQPSGVHAGPGGTQPTSAFRQ